MDKKDFSAKLLWWWRQNRREFPWRRTRNPYRILLSEILLHRTRASQVVPVYLTLVDRYPTVRALAEADYRELLMLTKRLGLFWRTNLILTTARALVDGGGRVPRRADRLQSLPGVGPYISSAVRIFAYGMNEVVIDTNTVRVISRLFGVTAKESTRRSKDFGRLADSLKNARYPRETNFALLDLAALICRPLSPKCSECPVSELCEYAKARIENR